MTIVHFKNKPTDSAFFNNLLSDIIPQLPSLYRHHFLTVIPVNIKEEEKEF